MENLTTLNPTQAEQLRAYCITQLMSLVDTPHRGLSEENLQWLSDHLLKLLQRTNTRLPDDDFNILLTDVADEVIGYGPIGPYLRDPSVSEVMVNGWHQIYVERKGKLIETETHYKDDAAVLRAVDNIVLPLGRKVDRPQPLVDARLPDGSRVNVIIPPCALNGPTVTIRKFPAKPLTVEDLISFGSLTQQTAEFLRACVATRLNIIVSGGTGSGKTTLLNVISSFIPTDERICTVEDSAELQLSQPHVIRLETAPALPDGSGLIGIRDLVRNALRMRPERIIVGEVRGGEALDMLQAMNTGHDGSLATVHANNPRDAVARLETLVLMAGFDLPVRVIRAQITSAVNLIVQQERLRDGSRKITRITEVQGLEGENVVLQDIFLFQAVAVSESDKVEGTLKPTGIRPNFSPRLDKAGFRLGGDIFGASTMVPTQGKRK
ncbi:Putative conjugal transfer protein [Thermoflexales bacterium]|nr:Putative conjugal transfer protein [Thermoflexales bacterium]